MDFDKVFTAFRNCISEPKCKDCPWEQCEQFNQKKVSIPVTLALDVLNMLKEQEDGYKNLLPDYEDLAREHQKLLEVKETMDIRDIAGLWCDDITFCPEKCGWKSCPRNKENIRDRTIPHSFSVEIPVDCPKKVNLREV